MREDCKHFQSRTYASGETVRKCKLDLAPEAPWRCPPDCVAYELQIYDAGFVRGSLAGRTVGPEPEGEHIAELLDEAEDIVNAALPEALAEAEKQQRRRWWRRGRRRR